MNPTTIARRLCLLSVATTLAIASSAVAGTGSIVYVKHDAIWVTSPAGRHEHRLTHGSRRFASPSQADNGTIVALGDDNHLYRFSHAGRRRGKPVATWLGLGGGQGFAGPYRTRVSPDGTKVALPSFPGRGAAQGAGGPVKQPSTGICSPTPSTPPAARGPGK